MKLIIFALIGVLFVLALADTKTCTGSRCKRMTNIVSQLYNDYDYGYGQGNGGGSNYNQNGQGNGGGSNYNQNEQGSGGGSNYNQNEQGYGGGSNNNQNGQGYGGGSNYNQNSDTDCPNCYARGFGNGGYNRNTINIEKK